MTTVKLHPGDTFPRIDVLNDQEQPVTLGHSEKGLSWQAIFVYRGVHCPMCTRYLNLLEGYAAEFAAAGVEVVAVSGDSAEQLTRHREQLNVSFPVFHGLTETQMQRLGVYVSTPRSAQETDHNFSEPALFVVNERGELHVVDLSNNPFVRPEVDTLLRGLKWIRNPKNNYPIRGAKRF